jgi:hypothetical protein
LLLREPQPQPARRSCQGISTQAVRRAS